MNGYIGPTYPPYFMIPVQPELIVAQQISSLLLMYMEHTGDLPKINSVRGILKYQTKVDNALGIQKYDVDTLISSTAAGTLLIAASQRGNIGMVNFLIRLGIDVTLDSDMAICSAAANGHYSIITVLLKSGADVCARNNYPVISASTYGHFKTVKVLMGNGADASANGNTPIMRASEGGHYKIIKTLLSNGADASANDNYPVNVASEHRYLDVIACLIEAGAHIRMS